MAPWPEAEDVSLEESVSLQKGRPVLHARPLFPLAEEALLYPGHPVRESIQ